MWNSHRVSVKSRQDWHLQAPVLSEPMSAFRVCSTMCAHHLAIACLGNQGHQLGSQTSGGWPNWSEASCSDKQRQAKAGSKQTHKDTGAKRDWIVLDPGKPALTGVRKGLRTVKPVTSPLLALLKVEPWEPARGWGRVEAHCSRPETDEQGNRVCAAQHSQDQQGWVIFKHCRAFVDRTAVLLCPVNLCRVLAAAEHA